MKKLAVLLAASVIAKGAIVKASGATVD